MPASYRDLARNDVWSSSLQRSQQRRAHAHGSRPRASWSDPTPQRAVRHALGRDLGDPQLWQRSLERARKQRVSVPRQRREARRRRNASFALSAAILAGPGGAFAPFAERASAHTPSGTDPAVQVDPESVDVDAAVAATAGAGEREMLRLGDVGEPVREAQLRLGTVADAIFGPQTDRAVRNFQAAGGLAVDGIVGPATWAALLSTHAQASSAPEPAPADLRVTEVSDDGEGGLNVELVADRPAERRAPSGRPQRAPAGGPVEQPAPRGQQPSRSVPVAQACGEGALVRPVNGPVTSPYGPRGGRTHAGMDIAAPVGTPIRAADCGTVTVAEWQGGYGRILCIQHSSSLTTCYAHLDRFAVQRGAQVQKGQIIGTVGLTGRTTGPHVHFETRVNGRAVNPAPYLSGSRTASSSQSTSARSSSAGTADSGSGSGDAAASGSSSEAQQPTARKAHSEPQQSEPAPEQGSQQQPPPEQEPEGGTQHYAPAPAAEGPATPVLPPEPAEPIEPIEPAEPIEPIEPVEPSEPVEPVAPGPELVEDAEALEEPLRIEEAAPAP